MAHAAAPNAPTGPTTLKKIPAPKAGPKVTIAKTPAAKAVSKKVNFKNIFRPSHMPKAAGGVPTVGALPDVKAPTVGGSMTIVVVVLIGAAVVLIGSALDGSSISDTFRKILAGDPINWTGMSADQLTAQKNALRSKPLIPMIPDGKGKLTCPAGYHSVVDSKGNGMCQVDGA